MKNKVKRFVHREGFWRPKDTSDLDAEELELPSPIPSMFVWYGKKKFVEAFEAVQNSEELIDAEKLRSRSFKGWSECRCCGVKNGSVEFKLKALGAIWTWPSGYLHYIVEHNIRPSLAFQEFIFAIHASLGENVRKRPTKTHKRL